MHRLEVVKLGERSTDYNSVDEMPRDFRVRQPDVANQICANTVNL